MKHFSLKTKSLKINTIFNGIYQILALLAPLLTTPYVSRIFNASILGDYNYYYSILGYFTLVATFGFNYYGTKVIAELRDNKEEKSKAFWSIMFAKALLSILCLGIYFIVFFSLFKGNQTAIYIFLSMTLYIVSILVDPIFYFQGNENFVSISIRNTLMRVLTIVLIFVFVKTQDDIVIYSIILSVGNLFATIIMFFSFKKGEINKPKWKELKIWKSFKESFPFFIPSLAVTLFTSLNQTLIGAFSDSAQSGYYSQAMKIISILSGIAGSLSIIMLSRMSYLFHTNNEKEIKKKIAQTFNALWIIAMPLFFGLLFITSRLVPAFFGAGYEGAIPVIYISSIIIILSPINTIYGSIYYKPKNKIWTQIIIILFSSALNVVLSLLLIPKYGANGAAVGRLIAEFAQFPLLFYYAKNDISLKDVFGGSIKALDSSLIMFFILFFFNKYIATSISRNLIVLIAEILIGALVYGVFEIIFKEEFVIQFLKSIKQKLKKKKAVHK